VKKLAARVGVSEEAVAAKIEQAESEGKDAANAVRPAEAGSRREQPKQTPRAAVRASGKPSARMGLEQLVLAAAVSFPEARAALTDLAERDFAQPEYQAIFKAARQRPSATGEKLAATLTELSKDINILLLVGERQLADMDPANRGIEAFELARRLRNLANHEQKNALIIQIREAERSGDLKLADKLTRQIQKLNEEEA
jgi:hypothetical protein